MPINSFIYLKTEAEWMGRETTPTLCMGNWVVDSGLSHIGLHLNEKNNGTYNSHYTKRIGLFVVGRRSVQPSRSL